MQTYPFFRHAVVTVYILPTSFFNISIFLPKNRVLTSILAPILSVKSIILLQLPSTYGLEAAEFSRLLSLSFNGHIFYKFSNILTHINNYLVGLQQVELYYNIIEQTATIFNIRLVFAIGLIKAVKKKKSWVMVNWNAGDIA